MADVAALRDEIETLRQQLEECGDALEKAGREPDQEFQEAHDVLDRLGVPRTKDGVMDHMTLPERIQWHAANPLKAVIVDTTKPGVVEVPVWNSGMVERDVDHTTPPMWCSEGDGTVTERVCGCYPRVHNRGEWCPHSYLTRKLGPQ